MIARCLAFLALCLLLPVASAAAPPGASVTKETDMIAVGTGSSGAVFLQLDYTVTDPATFSANATWIIFAPAGGPEPTVKLVRERVSSAVDASRVNQTGTSGAFATWSVDLKGSLAGLKAGENQSLLLTYPVDPASIRMKTTAALPSLVVFVQGASGRSVTGTGIGPFNPAGNDQHAVVSNAADGLEYTIMVGPPTTAPGGVRDLNTWLWVAVGAAVGFLLAVILARRGVIGGAKAKKFEKGGAMESQKVLEARRRTLMAALKELELAHEAKEIPDEAYAPLKEEYKAQAVRVMRSLEEKKEPGQG